MDSVTVNPRLSSLRLDYQEFVKGILDKNVDDTVDDKTFFQRGCLRSLLIYYSELDRRPLATDAIHISFDGAISIVDSPDSVDSKPGLTIPFTVKTIFAHLPNNTNEEIGFIVSPLIGLSWNILKHVRYSLNSVALDELCKEFRCAVANQGINANDFGRYLSRLGDRLKLAPEVPDNVLDNDRDEGFKRVTNQVRFPLFLVLAFFCTLIYFGYTILKKAFS